MSSNIKIKGLNKLKRDLSDPEKLAKHFIDNAGGVEVKCPSCGKSVKVPSAGVTCSCGQHIDLSLNK